MMDWQDKSKEELLKELQELQGKYNSLKESYNQVTVHQLQTENDLLISEQRYHTLIDLAAEGILIGSNEGIIIEANKQMSVILAMPKHEILGKHISQLPFKPESIDKKPWRFDLLYKGETVVNQRTFIRPDGTEIIVELHTKMMPDGTLQSIYLDITEQTQAQEELRLSEEKFRQVFETNPDSININRLADGAYISVNKGFTQIMEYAKEEVIGKTSLELNIWQNSNDRKRLVEAIKAKGFVEKLEAKFITKSGRIIDGEMSAAVINLKGIPHIINISRDVTKQKQTALLLKEKTEEIEAQNKEYLQINEELNQTNQELLLAKEHAEESDRLKTAFLQNMSHEIRTPMNAIIGFSELMTESLEEPAKLEKYSGIIVNRSYDLLDIIEDILDISKIESGQLAINLEDCNLIELLSEIRIFFAEYQKRLAKENIELKMVFPPEQKFKYIQADNGKLKQIFINLISNAFKFTLEGSIEYGCKMEGNDLIFFVKDTGIGIPEDKHEKIFERFAQLQQIPVSGKGGTGLGLSIVKGLLKLMNGRVWLESEMLKGSTFYFTFQFEKAQSSVNEFHQNTTDKSYSFAEKAVLIVEDDKHNAAYLKEVLGPTGITITATEMGCGAVELVKSQPFDIVLMDIRLPDITGYEATKLIKLDNPNIKIIAQTAYASKDEKKKALEAGCIDYLSKPTKKEILLFMVDKYINQ